MGWRARSEPVRQYDSGQEMMLWLVDTYEVVARHAIEPEDDMAVDADSHVPAVVDPPPALFTERRAERRADCGFDVAAAAVTDCLDTALGEAVDISVSGVRLVMDKAAEIGPVDLIVADLIVAARVVGHHELDDGRHSWHVHVLGADDGWLELARRG